MMSSSTANIIISIFCCIGLISLFAGISELPSYFLNNPKITASIINYNNTSVPNVFSFIALDSKICSADSLASLHIQTDNIICDDNIKCPSNMELGQTYTMYCSCGQLRCSFEPIKDETERTFILYTTIIGGSLLSISIIYLICLGIYYCCKKHQTETKELVIIVCETP